ncbi:hypothetical protein [Paraburkholderia phenazinium]|uniref:hypothetical protein n=1 Tax=Paraburkholderia phenazinium TaxID=60549 RepID=UPI00158DB129|nr:hypothetical protein [Paraburkholderia phenazinium]
MKARYRIRFVPSPYVRPHEPHPGRPVIPNGRQHEPFRVERRTWFGWREIDSARTWEGAQMFLDTFVRTMRIKGRVLQTFDQHGKEIAR